MLQTVIKKTALKLFGIIVKQVLIMSPLLFSQESAGDFEGTVYTKEH